MHMFAYSRSLVYAFVISFTRQLLKAKSATVLNTLYSDSADCDVIGIDEGQFVSSFLCAP